MSEYARGFFDGAVLAVVAAFIVAMLLCTAVHAADLEQCRKLGIQVGQVVEAATDDFDLRQLVEQRVEAHCIVLDEPGLRVKVDSSGLGTVPATGPEETTSAKDRWCKRHYASFRPSDDTVLRRGSRNRVPCPYKE
jgi:hypothetical protein